MADEYEVAVKKEAREEASAMILSAVESFGERSGVVVQERIESAIDGLAANPTRHTRVRYLIGRQFVYRRVLVGSYYRVIFTVDEDARRVDVVRVDSQRSDPATLDDLP